MIAAADLFQRMLLARHAACLYRFDAALSPLADSLDARRFLSYAPPDTPMR